MIGKRVEKNDYGNPSGRDGLGHCVDVGYHGQSGWSARIGAWKGGDAIGANGGTFLEQCLARDYFFGCGRNHSEQTEYLGRYDPRRIGWRYAIDGAQGGTLNFNEMEDRLGNQYALESRYARSSGCS